MLLKLLAKWWRVHDTLPSRLGAIVVVSYGANEKSLTMGSLLCAMRAKYVHRQYPGTEILFCDFKMNPDPSMEFQQKQGAFPHALYAGSAGTSFEESENIRTVIEGLSVEGDIGVIADEWFSRRARRVWRSTWDGTDRKIFFSTFPWQNDERNPMKFQRSTLTWALLNIAMVVLMRLPGGFEFFRKRNFVQPT